MTPSTSQWIRRGQWTEYVSSASRLANYYLKRCVAFAIRQGESGGHLRWNLTQIFAEIKTGLRDAGERGRQLGRSIRSIGR